MNKHSSTINAEQATELDSAWVRAAFPALAHGEALFDNAGGSIPPRAVIDELSDYLATCSVQLGASYGASARAAARVDAGRAAVATMIGAQPDELVFGPSTTRNAATFALGMASQLASGDEIVVTNLDHEANRGPWAKLARDGVALRTWNFRPDTAALHVEDLEPLLGERTRVVAVPRASNLLGTVVDLAAVDALVRPTGALFAVDEVAHAPHSPAWGPSGHGDLVFASLYKTLGPHVGVAWTRPGTRERFANQNHGFYEDDYSWRRFEPGGVSHEAVAAMRGVLTYWLAFDEHHDGQSSDTSTDRVRRAMGRAAAHERGLTARLIEFVEASSEYELYGPASAAPDQRVPIVSFRSLERSSRRVVEALDKVDLGVRHGHFYAPEAARVLGLDPGDGVVRVSFAHYNTQDELGRLIGALDRSN